VSARRFGSLAAGFLLLLFLFAPAADAQSGYEGGGTLTCTPTTVVAGQQVTCTVTGCNTGSTATFTLNGNQVGTAVAQSPASVSFVIPPGTPPGQVEVAATCDGLSAVLTTTLTVIDGAEGGGGLASGGGGLPATGSNSVSWVQVAVALIVVGALLVLASRKRRQARTPVAA
jgi:LPXTG-motif cell wall-anchored protein